MRLVDAAPDAWKAIDVNVSENALSQDRRSIALTLKQWNCTNSQVNEYLSAMESNHQFVVIDMTAAHGVSVVGAPPESSTGSKRGIGAMKELGSVRGDGESSCTIRNGALMFIGTLPKGLWRLYLERVE